VVLLAKSFHLFSFPFPLQTLKIKMGKDSTKNRKNDSKNEKLFWALEGKFIHIESKSKLTH
jgi:hypothetical protein